MKETRRLGPGALQLLVALVAVVASAGGRACADNVPLSWRPLLYSGDGWPTRSDGPFQHASLDQDHDSSAGGAPKARLLQDVPACLSSCKSSTYYKLPVCGNDGNTYDGECFANCYSVKAVYNGKCAAKPCLCSEIWAPVCGGNRSFTNPCEAKCYGVTAHKPGLCASDCSCPATNAPVCGLDGVTYANACKARCSQSDTYYSGPCDARVGSCKCGLEYAPVCVLDTNMLPMRVTYPNLCLAKCYSNLTAGSGASYTTGLCPKLPKYNPSTRFCGCSLKFKPVCAVFPAWDPDTRIDFLSRCDADCAGAKVLYDGLCRDTCYCPTISPVCVGGKKTYASACRARCDKATTWTPGECAV